MKAFPPHDVKRVRGKKERAMLTFAVIRTWLQRKNPGRPADLPDDDRAFPRPVDRSPEIEQALCSYRITTF